MQSLTAPPRDGFTVAQVTALLTAPDLTVDFGAELLDAPLALVEDISADLSGGTIHRNNLADIHGTCELTISRALAWGAARVRPFMLLSSATAGVSGCRFNLGVYLLTTPDRHIGEDPASYAAVGYDQLHILQTNIGNSWAAPTGAPVLTAVRTLVASAGVLSPVLLDSTAEAKTLESPMVRPLTSSESPTYIRVINDLLACVGYRGLWADQDGNLRSGPYVLPELRASEFDLSVGDLVTGIVAQDRTVTNDVWNVPNWMRVVRNGLPYPPEQGDGWHTMSNPAAGPSSVASVGRLVKAPVVFLDATSQSDLMTQGRRLFALATRSSEVITMKTSPMPALWHWDRLEYDDAALGAVRQIQVRSWDLPLTGDDMSVVAETVA